jgi:hypothetical protein
MAAAFGWGALGAAALLIGSLIAYQLAPSRQVIAVVMALGTGLLIGSVSFELIDEALSLWFNPAGSFAQLRLPVDARVGQAARPCRCQLPPWCGWVASATSCTPVSPAAPMRCLSWATRCCASRRRSCPCRT